MSTIASHDKTAAARISMEQTWTGVPVSAFVSTPQRPSYPLASQDAAYIHCASSSCKGSSALGVFPFAVELGGPEEKSLLGW